MAISLISPGIKVTEQDLVASQQAITSTAGAFSGQFRWGPIEDPVVVTGESDLAEKFGKPNSNTVVDFLSAANFLGYSAPLFVIRVANTALNSTAEATTGSGTDGTGILIKNDDSYEGTSSFNVGPWAAKFAGNLGNSIRVSTCPSAEAFQSTLTGTWTVAVGNTTVTSTAGAADTEVSVGDLLVLGGRTIKVASVSDANTIVLSSAHLTGETAGTAVRRWEFFPEFDGPPGTSTDGAAKGAVGDEMHIAVADRAGAITGSVGTLLEKFSLVSKGSDAKADNGGTNFYLNVINDRSQYIRWTAHDSEGTNWGSALSGTTYTAVTLPLAYNLAGGSDGIALTDGDRTTGYLLLSNKDQVPVSLIVTGQATVSVVNRVINDIAEVRKDAVVVASPPRTAVVNNAGSEVTSINSFANSLTRSTFVFLDSGWKYQYDKYNDTYVYVPLNADVAGLMARNDLNRDPWISPAGYINGQIANLVRLAFNPNQAERDALYKNSVNPVITQPGKGTVLFGDKTFTTKSTSLNRLNVRRLFIELQKTISNSADNVLFERNDATTRTNFVNLITPYLRSVQARRGINAFRVVCDATNNPESTVNANEFICDIFVQPVRSVNFIQLNFVSVAGSATFNEIAG
jgi:hypothetical protein